MEEVGFQNFILNFKNSIRLISSAEERAKTLELPQNVIFPNISIDLLNRLKFNLKFMLRKMLICLEGTSVRVKNNIIFNDPFGLQPTIENEEEDIREEFGDILDFKKK